MFGIKTLDGKFLDLVEKQSPVIELVSTAFNNSDQLLGSFSYDIELADTPNNTAVLGPGNQLANRSYRKDLEVIIYLFGEPWKKCTLSYDIIKARRVGQLLIDQSQFAEVIKEKELPTVFMKITNGSFVDHNWIPLGLNKAQTIASILTSLTPGASPYTFYPFRNELLFGEYNGEDGAQGYDPPQVINKWHQDFFESGTPTVDERKKLWYSPSFSLVWVIKEVCTWLGYEARGSFLESDFAKSLVIDNGSVYNFDDVFSAEGFKIAPARHLPKIKLNELFKHLREHFRIIYNFDSDTRQAHFTLCSEVIANPNSINLEGFVDTSVFDARRTSDNGFEFPQPVDPDDQTMQMFPYVKSYTIGDGLAPKKIELSICTTNMVVMANDHSSGNPNYRIPFIRQTGNAYGQKATGSQAHNPEDYGRNKFAFRLLSYQGLQPDTLGNMYPYAVSDGLAPDGITPMCNSLWLGGSRGILETYQKDWFKILIQGDPVTVPGNLPNLLINKLGPTTKMRFPSAEGVIVESLFNRMAFETSDEKQLLNTELTVFPIYLFDGSDLIINSQFTPGQVVGPKVLYAKLFYDLPRVVYRRPFLGPKQVFMRSANLVVEFWEDFACTVQKEVKDVNIYMSRWYRGLHPENYRREQVGPFLCNGFSTTVIERALLYYDRGNEHYTYDFNLVDGAGYVAIGTYTSR